MPGGNVAPFNEHYYSTIQGNSQLWMGNGQWIKFILITKYGSYNS